MKIRLFYLMIPLLVAACQQHQERDKKLTSFVNTFIGTDGPGNTYPGATVPFGMVQLSPDIGIPGWDRIAGYYYQDSIISGFSHMHLTGTGAGDLYDILVMPTNSRYEKRIPENGYRPHSRFSHDAEEAEPGYYRVVLSDYGITSELTTTRRTGIHRYTFPEDENSQLHIDLGYALNWDRPTDTYLNVVDESTIEGYRKSTGWAKDQRVYFVLKLSRPFDSYALYEGDSLKNEPVSGVDTKAIINLKTAENEKVVLKTGISTASIEGAYASLNEEAPHFDFDRYKQEASALWEQELQKVRIKISSEEKKTIFYTMLYQSMLAPTLLSDTQDKYKGANHQVMSAKGFDRYDTFSLWDTYRAAHPLYTILHAERTSDMIKSLLAHYKETGLLPVWSMQGNETNMMIGYHAIPVVVDAYFKGIEGIDVELAYEACYVSAMADDRQIDSYKEMGYVPIDEAHENWSVSKTMEYAYDDWCLAQFAKDLGKMDDYDLFMKRSENWRNLYDASSTFFRPRYADGSFLEDFVPKDYSAYYCESNAWHYFWNVPQNVEGLIAIVGGAEAFEQKLDSMFTYDPLPEDKLPIFSTGMIGQYAHGNEPSHHVGYLYNFIEKPWKTQELVRRIMETQYRNAPDGHCGNEDCGQMSSWYIFSALGFYPVNPAQGIYMLGSPLIDNAVIAVREGSEFRIIVHNNSRENTYIESVELNGEPLNRNYIRHSEIMEGGTLIFTMTDQPVVSDPGTDFELGRSDVTYN